MFKRFAVTAVVTAALAAFGQPTFAADKPAAKPSPVATKASAKPPASAPAAQMPPQKGMVWANPDSKIYHVEGSQFYGKTAKGVWMTEAAAKAKGFRAAGAKPDAPKTGKPSSKASPATK